MGFQNLKTPKNRENGFRWYKNSENVFLNSTIQLQTQKFLSSKKKRCQKCALVSKCWRSEFVNFWNNNYAKNGKPQNRLESRVLAVPGCPVVSGDALSQNRCLTDRNRRKTKKSFSRRFITTEVTKYTFQIRTNQKTKFEAT